MARRVVAALCWWLATTFACLAGMACNLASEVHVAPGPGLSLVSEGSTYYLLDIAPITIAGGALPVATLMGLLQWLVMRRRLSRAGGWVPATIVGWVFGLFVGPGMGGIVLGVLQYLSVVLCLRRAFLGLLWPLASVLAWTAGAAVQARFPAASALFAVDRTPLLGWTVGWAVYALLTAFAFVAFLAWDEAPAARAPRAGLRPTAGMARVPREVAPGPAFRSESTLRGPRLFGAWLVVGIAGVLVDQLAGPRSPSIVGFAAATFAQGWLLQLALGLPIVWAWTVATVVGGVLGAAFGTVAARGFSITPGTTTELGALALASLVFGLTIGLAQWVVLRRGTHRAWLWIPTMVLVVLVPSLLGARFSGVPSWVGRLAGPILTGAAVMLLLPPSRASPMPRASSGPARR